MKKRAVSGADNLSKYLKPPTVEQVMIVVNAHGVNMAQFERYYGMYPLLLAQLKQGKRRLPPKYWHIIFESLEKLEAGLPLPKFAAPPKSEKQKRTVCLKKGVLKNKLISELL